MKRYLILASVPVLLAAAIIVLAQGIKQFQVNLSGFQEVPAVSTIARGDFNAQISRDAQSVSYELSYANLEGNVTQAHIHLGQKGVNGGIFVFLCSNLGNGPAGTQLCPPAPATITGTFTGSDMVGGAAAQGLAPGEFDELIRAVSAGVTYANVHSSKFPGGEVRSQIEAPDVNREHSGH